MTSIPNLSRAADIAVRAETERRLTIVAIAEKRFQLAHGTLPRSLDELVPEFLFEVPGDPMGSGPLHFKQSQDGAFCLYSVGEDGHDDGGDPTGSTNKFGFWDGHDAVWPAAVKPHERLELR